MSYMNTNITFSTADVTENIPSLHFEIAVHIDATFWCFMFVYGIAGVRIADFNS